MGRTAITEWISPPRSDRAEFFQFVVIWEVAPGHRPSTMLPAHHLEQLESLHTGAYGWALLCCSRDRDHAADVLQTSYARIIAGEARFDDRSDLRAFLFGVVKRVAHESQRSRCRSARREQAAGVAAYERPEASVGSELEHTELQEHMRLALSRLSVRQREVLHLRFYEGVTIEAAAKILGIGVGSARRHYERGKKALREPCEGLREHLPAQRPGYADELRGVAKGALKTSYERP